MPIETWKAEFYSKPAFEAISSDRKAISHSIQKWKGTIKKNLEKHEMVYDNYWIKPKNEVYYSKNWFEFNWANCALCRRYHDTNNDTETVLQCYSEKEQTFCPIVRMRGYSCSEIKGRKLSGLNCYTEWEQACDNPDPILQLLKDTEQFILTENKDMVF